MNPLGDQNKAVLNNVASTAMKGTHQQKWWPQTPQAMIAPGKKAPSNREDTTGTANKKYTVEEGGGHRGQASSPGQAVAVQNERGHGTAHHRRCQGRCQLPQKDARGGAFAFSSPLAKTLNRTTYPASLKTTHSNATPTHLQSTVIAANCAQEAPCQKDHPTMPTDPSTAAVTATQILCGVSHVWAL